MKVAERRLAKYRKIRDRLDKHLSAVDQLETELGWELCDLDKSIEKMEAGKKVVVPEEMPIDYEHLCGIRDVLADAISDLEDADFTLYEKVIRKTDELIVVMGREVEHESK